MPLNEIYNLLRLRVVISFLGEKSQFNLWQSDFFGPAATSFLDPSFPRTRFLAQVEGATAAAGKLHDDRIGVGRVFHLFRLPEDFEQSFHHRLQDHKVIEELTPILASQEIAMNFLEREFGKQSSNQVGPVRVGSIEGAAEKKELVKSIGQLYLAGFQAESPVFPFLKDEQ
jgi:hypothetical protein